MPLRYGSNPLGGDCFYVAGRACPAPTAGANLYIQKSRAQKDSAFAVSDSHLWSEWRESNSRPLEPHTSELPNSTLHPVKIGYFYFNCYNQLKTIIRGYCSPPCGISWYDSDSIDMASILLPRNAISILIIIRDKSMAHTHLLMMTS